MSWQVGWSVTQFSHSVVSDSLRPQGLQHTRPPCPLPTPGVYSNSCPLSRWCHPTISSSVIPFSSWLQSFPASGSFPISQFFASGGQSIGVSASASVLPMTIQDWFPLGWTSWISLQSKGLSRVFSSTTIQNHEFFGTQLSLWSNSHMSTDYWKQCPNLKCSDLMTLFFFFFYDFLHVDVSCNHHTNQHQLTEYFQHPKFPLTIPLLHSLSSGNRDAKFQHHWLVLPLLLVHVNKMIRVCHAVTSQYSFFFFSCCRALEMATYSSILA